MWSGTVARFVDLGNGLRNTVLRGFQKNGFVLPPQELAFGSAWQKALDEVQKLLTPLRSELADCTIILEGRMPTNPNRRADFILLGTGARGAVVVLELKMWPFVEGVYDGQVRLNAEATDPKHYKQHPSWQVRGYRDTILLYHAAMVNREPKSIAEGFVYLPAARVDSVRLANGESEYDREQNAEMLGICPAFGRGQEDALRKRIVETLKQGGDLDPHFTAEFLKFERRSDASLGQMAGSMKTAWPLIDEQGTVAASVLHEIHASREGGRRVVIVTGGPGSGKTHVAVHVLLAAMGEGMVNAGLVTTCGAQNDAVTAEMKLGHNGKGPGEPTPKRRNVRHGEELSLSVYGARQNVMKIPVEAQAKPDFIKAARLENPGLSKMQLEQLWEDYCSDWGERFRTAWRDSKPPFDLLVCDESQGLPNPEDPVSASRCVGPAAWTMGMGPAAAHLIAKAQTSIFFIDHDQGYRDFEGTSPRARLETNNRGRTIRGIRETALLLGVSESNITQHSLGSLQFRLAGSALLAHWIDWLLGLRPDYPMIGPDQEHGCTFDVASLEKVFHIHDSPSEMRDSVRKVYDNGELSCRLLSSYSWRWVSRNPEAAHHHPVDSVGGLVRKDRPEPGMKFRWLTGEQRQVEFSTGGGFFQSGDNLFGNAAGAVAHVGYPLVVRGREFKHVGVMWGENFVRRDGHWDVYRPGDGQPDADAQTQLQLIFEDNSDWTETRKKTLAEIANGEPMGPWRKRLINCMANSIRILLTRGMETVSVWIEDPPTRQYVREQWQELLRRCREAAAKAEAAELVESSGHADQ